MEDKGFAPWLSSETGLIKRRVVFFCFAGQSFSPRGFDWVFTVFPLVSRNRYFSCASTLCHIHVSCCFGWCVQFLVDYILFFIVCECDVICLECSDCIPFFRLYVAIIGTCEGIEFTGLEFTLDFEN